MSWITCGLAIIATLAALPAVVIALQVVMALLPRRAGPHRAPPAGQAPARPAAAVLVPAHNEADGIRATVESISVQLLPGDRLIVIADNCTDETAQIARDSGAEVVERNDLAHRGKGYALQAGLAHVAAGSPPPFVVIVDADCRLQPSCLDALVAQAATSYRPTQGCYLMAPPAAPRAVDVVSALAVLVKNRVRPLAMSRLGYPCLITGSGAAFPWGALETRSFEGANIVEDMQLAIDLALAGWPPAYCDNAVLSAALPDRPTAFVSQRRRWEHGHLRTLIEQVPRLAVGSLRSGRLELAAMAVDLAVPPLSLLVALNFASLVVSLLAFGFGAGWLPAAISVTSLALLAASIGLTWWRFAREWMPFRFLLGVPVYVLAKLPLYAAFFFRREAAWVRTARGSHAASE